ncbi:MAG: thioredoxin family protein [Candidatus Cloacimonadales bacterium]
MTNKRSKIITAAVILVITAAVIGLKISSQQSSPSQTQPEILDQAIVAETVEEADSSPTAEVLEATPQPTKSAPQSQMEPGKAQASSTAKAKPQSQPQAKPNPDILATVNGKNLDKEFLDASFAELPAQLKANFKANLDGFLQQLILREILLQSAEKAELLTRPASKQQEDEAIQKLLARQMENIEVSESEIRDFFAANKAQMPTANFAEVQTEIKNHLIQQKQNSLLEAFIAQQQASAEIEMNERWLEAQIAARPENPLTKALKNGLPTIVKLGSDSCVPCKMMKPILAELEAEYGERANILDLETADHQDLTSQYKVRIIPTSIFFDQNGQQYERQEGFLEKAKILEILKAGGMQ